MVDTERVLMNIYISNVYELYQYVIRLAGKQTYFSKFTMDVVTTSKIIEARRAVKQKLEALKRNELLVEKSFAPITAPLRSIAEQIKHEPRNNFNVKNESKLEPIIEQEENTNENIELPDNIETSSSSSNLSKTYISGLIHDTKNKYDFTYGVRYNPDDGDFYIGNSNIKFDNNSLVIRDREYPSTRGLYELLFKRIPRGYTAEDKKHYINILKSTSAHKRNYDSSKQVSGTNSWKYKNIIKSMIRGPRVRHDHVGTGASDLMMQVTDNAIDYVHWDDPNELVDRLRLLVASQAAGNSNHTNEINSIIEELIEAEIIAPQ